VVNPPRLRPRAWSGGSPGGWFSPRARGDAMRPDVAAVDAPESPVDLAGRVQLTLERREDAVPEPLARPASEARVHGRPRPVAVGEVAPLAPGRVAVEHAVEHRPVIPVVGPACLRRRQEGRDARPLCLGQLVPVCHAPVLDGEPAESRRHRATPVRRSLGETCQFGMRIPL
jgi:hypothetical protein